MNPLAGFTVIEDEPDWKDTSCVALRYLQTPDGGQVTEDAINDPSRWAVLLCEDEAWADRETGRIVDETSIDWSTQDDADAVPGEGKRRADSVVETTVYTPEWFCLDYVGAGLDLIDWD